MEIKGAIFDMDGTLVDSLMFWGMEWKLFGERFLGIKDFVPAADLDAAIRTMTMKECAVAVRAYYNLPITDEEMLDFFNQGLFDFYRSHASLKSGVIEFLNRLQKMGIPMCIASATDGETVGKVVKLFGLDRYMLGIVSCTDSDVMKGKDQPVVYQKALKLLHTRPEETAVFEDSYVALETARKMGMKTVGLYDRYNYHQDRLMGGSDIYIAEGHSIDETDITAKSYKSK